MRFDYGSIVIFLTAVILIAVGFIFSCSLFESDGHDSFTDKRDGKKYKTVVIGNQTWMAENLNYDAEGGKCYENKPENCKKYGKLYDWKTAMVLPSTCDENKCSDQIQSNHQGICPDGWHIPSQADWNVLMAAVGGESTAGIKLKTKKGWYINGSDEFGFSALPGGEGISDDYFNNIGNIGAWWSASEENSHYAYERRISFVNEVMRSGEKKSKSLSVRCVKDD